MTTGSDRALAAALAGVVIALVIMVVHLTDSRMDGIEDRLREVELRIVENPTAPEPPQ